MIKFEIHIKGVFFREYIPDDQQVFHPQSGRTKHESKEDFRHQVMLHCSYILQDCIDAINSFGDYVIYLIQRPPE